MKNTYKAEEFEGYSHRFRVQFDTGENHYRIMDLYSDSGDKSKLEDFIEERKGDSVLSFKIVNVATKEQDEKMAELINETLKDL